MSRNQGDQVDGFFWSETQSWSFANAENNDNALDHLISDNNANEPMGLSFNNNQGIKEATGLTTPSQVSPIVTSKRRHTAMPPPKNVDGKIGSGGETDDHDVHIWTERERRKKMKNMFSSLHALLPQLAEKADKSTIVEEAVNTIRNLELTITKIQKQKLDRVHDILMAPVTNLPGKSREAFLADQGSSANPFAGVSLLPGGHGPINSSPVASPKLPSTFQTWSSPNVVINLCGDTVNFNFCLSKGHGALSGILGVMEKYKLEVLTAQVSSNGVQCLFLIQAHAKFESSGDKTIESYTLEDVCKQAAAEMLVYISPN